MGLGHSHDVTGNQQGYDVMPNNHLAILTGMGEKGVKRTCLQVAINISQSLQVAIKIVD